MVHKADGTEAKKLMVYEEPVFCLVSVKKGFHRVGDCTPRQGGR